MDMKDLKDIRDEIDVIDRKIVELYEERMKLTTEVADYKIQKGKNVFDSEREISKLRTLEGQAHTDFTRQGVHELFEHIMAMSRKKQYQLLTEYGRTFETDFDLVDVFEIKGKKIALIENTRVSAGIYLPGAEFCICSTLDELFENLCCGSVDYGFIEVGTERFYGNVIGYYNQIAEHNCYIAASYADERDETKRCLLITRRRAARRDAQYLSMCFEAPDQCGTLYHLLSHITYNDLNLNRIGSVVIATDPLDYRFFVDVSGNLHDSSILNAVRGLSAESRNFKIFGNY